MKFLVRAAAAMGLMALLAGTAHALTAAEEKIVERIRPIGEVCVEGQDCGEAAQPVAAAGAAAGGARSGADVYQAACFACHATGAAGAPKLGDAAAWAPRIEKGMETLVSHAINGFNAMPPKGGCMACSDEEVTNAVQHMVDGSK